MPQKFKKRINISTVAKAAGISEMTVSRVINNKDNVAPETRERVQNIIAEMNYRPNMFARNLASNKTKTEILGMIVSGATGTENQFKNILGIENEAQSAGYSVLFASDGSKRDITQTFKPGLVDGVVYFGGEMEQRIVDFFEIKHIPYVVIGKRRWNSYQPDYFSADYFSGYKGVTDYLIHLGHRKIAMYGGVLTFEADIPKFDGYWSALEAAKICRDQNLEIEDTNLNDIVRLLNDSKPTAIIVNGLCAWNRLLTEISEKGYRVPSHFSIVVSGLNIDFSERSMKYLLGVNELSRLEIPDFDMGMYAIRHLLKKLNGESALPKENYINMKFIKGDSCREIGASL